MPNNLENLLEDYSSSVSEGKAALFIGAGLSRFPRGFVDWTELMRPYARQVGLEADKESDLVAVAQYYLNSKNRERSFLNKALIEEFDRPQATTPSHRIIAQLPVSTIWTTNYDRLIEEAFRRADKYLDVKMRDKDIGFSRRRCDAVLYKMHGDISQPDKVIISKEDYELYGRIHPIFQNKLTLDLLEKSFLFLGFSFADPNLNYTLGHLCSLLKNTKRAHYALMRRLRPKGEWDENTKVFKQTEDEAEFKYRKRKEELRIDDLQRYGIDTVLFKRDKEVPRILMFLERRIRAQQLIRDLVTQYNSLSEKRVKKIVYEAFGIPFDFEHDSRTYHS